MLQPPSDNNSREARAEFFSGRDQDIFYKSKALNIAFFCSLIGFLG